ncbi:phosphopantetheine-binding protein, partial [Actinoplanes sp. NPDC048967]|uniref:phosphopantetheine-binding protein n=1 Tax=Actinoplanes sp. NPDC048967 TaxID=3155269 RepID=UPI0034096CE6
GRGRRVRRLRTSHAFHSVLMEPMLGEFAAVVRGLEFGEGFGRWSDPGFWVSHVREPVFFADAVRGFVEGGVRSFVELGPDATLSGLVPGIVDGVETIPAMRRDTDEVTAAVTALARVAVRRTDIDLSSLIADGHRVALPTYPFQRRRYWLKGNSTMEDAVPVTTGTDEEAAAKLRDFYAGLPAAEQRETLIGLVIAEAAATPLENPLTEPLDGETPFFEVGFNSLSAVEMRNRIAAATGLTLTPMLLFDHPTPEMIADHLIDQLAAQTA